MSTEQQLRDLFAADAAAARDGLEVAAAVCHRIQRRRRVQTMGAAAAAAVTAAVLVAVAVFGPSWTTGWPQAQFPTTAAAPSPTSPDTGGLPRGATPGGPLPDSVQASCAKAYSAVTLAQNAFAFDGTVARIGPGSTDRDDTHDLGLRSVTFHINTWFKGGTGDTAVVDLDNPDGSGTLPGDEAVPTYQIGTRLLVTGMPRWGGAPLHNAIGWGCGFTRYYSPGMAAQWATATK